VRGPQSQRKSLSAYAQVCKDRERKQCNLLSYCAAPQPLCNASCDGKCARKWHFHCNSHACQHALHQRTKTPPICHTPSSLASSLPSSLTPSRPHLRHALWLRWPMTGTPPGRPLLPGGAHLAPLHSAAPGAGTLYPPSGLLQGFVSYDTNDVRCTVCRPLGCCPRLRRESAGRHCKVAGGTVRNLCQPIRGGMPSHPPAHQLGPQGSLW
jgi:hypothetical protein